MIPRPQSRNKGCTSRVSRAVSVAMRAPPFVLELTGRCGEKLMVGMSKVWRQSFVSVSKKQGRVIAANFRVNVRSGWTSFNTMISHNLPLVS